MFFRKPKEKELRMIWEVKKSSRCSFLVGTAHFFPYSFRKTFSHYMKYVDTVLFEGPLDKDNMGEVKKAGYSAEDDSHLFDKLDKKTIDNISKTLFPSCRSRRPFLVINQRTIIESNPVYIMIQGMKPWMAFFTIWTDFLEKRGWKNSVDLEAYNIALEMGKKVVFLETIEEQIKVLENLSEERIIDFLKQIEHWNDYAKKFKKFYLEGNLEKLRSISTGFPSRLFSVIDRRDQLFYDRMRIFLEKGEAIACVGAPHVPGIRKLLHAGGYKTEKIGQAL